MEHAIQLTVNGEPVREIVQSSELLVDFLRGRLELTGTKQGCESGVCGTCTVVCDGAAIKSCLRFAFLADGCELLTVEKLAEGGELHPIQRAFLENGGLQCGFCTPGMLMSAMALLEQNADPSEAEIRDALVGNLCRCTGYVKIIDSVKAAAAMLRSG
ncbi:MAG: (2Fe-2S)-binding protein [Nitrospinota bacterium]